MVHVDYTNLEFGFILEQNLLAGIFRQKNSPTQRKNWTKWR